VAILLVLASPPADAGAVRAKAAVEPTSSSVESTVSSLLKQAEEIEAELAQTPGDEVLSPGLAILVAPALFQLAELSLNS
jgi:hypothetical protein